MIIDGISLRKHAFPQKIKDRRFCPRSLYEEVRDVRTWMNRVVQFAKANKTDGYTLAQIEGDAFEHLVECIIERYGHDDSEVDSVVVGAPHEGYPGIDLLGRTRAGTSHAHQCKFKGGAKKKKLGMDDFSGVARFELTPGSHRTLWTTADGVNSQVEKVFRDHVKVLSIDWLCEALDGDDSFWADAYAGKFEAEVKRRNGLIDDEKLSFANPDRSYQMDALKKFKEEVEKNSQNLKGRYIYPTSAGKTLIEALILNHQLTRLDGFGVHVVIAPRIALLTQLMREFREFIGDKYDQIGFHSGEQEYEGGDYDQILKLSVQRKTTKIKKVLSEVERARRDDFPLVIFSTYHSLHKLVRKEISLETMIADESQYCISKRYFESVQNIDSKVKLYFTATERRATTGQRRNNNVEAFGEILGTEQIEVLVKRNILAEPRLLLLIGKSDSIASDSDDKNILDVENRDEDEEDAIAKHLIDLTGHVAEEQRKRVNDALPAKTLFACKSAKHIRIILGEKNLKSLKNRVKDIDPNRGHAIFTISAETGAKVDGEKVSRGDFLKRLGEHKGNALVFHHDILSEGIDIDGITGVAILRNMRYAKTLQTIGRCLRPYKDDVSLKPHAFVSVPVINGDVRDSDLLENTIRQMLTSGIDVNYEDINIRFLDKDPPRRSPEPNGSRQGRGKWSDGGQPSFGLDLHQERLKDVVHEVKILTEKVKEEMEEKEHAIMLIRVVTDDFVSDLLDGNYRQGGTPLDKDLATSRNQHHIVERVWETGRFKDSKLLKTKDGFKPMRPVTPIKIVKDHVDRIGYVDRKSVLTFNIEYVPYLKEKGAEVVLATKYFCGNTKTVAESQVIEAEYLELGTVMKRNMKFDVVVGNPPYQERKEGYKKSQDMWPFFVESAVEILKENGTLALIHPPGWRNSGGGVLENT